MKLLQFVVLTYQFIAWNIGVESKVCKSPQYIKIDTSGIIQCSFREDVYGLLWYNSTDLVNTNAILILQDSAKSGQGFESGEFDVYPNGSLSITNVSMKHETTYSVIKLDTPSSRPVTYTISVVVIAQAFERIPVISNCRHESEVCFQILDHSSEILCTVRDSRPAVPLTWMVRTIESDRNLSSTLLFRNETHPFVTSQATVTYPFVYTEMLALLVCKANGPPGLLERNESLLLLQNTKTFIRNRKTRRVLVEIDSRLQLTCTDSQISYLVWQVNRSSGNIFETILYAVFLGVNVTHIVEEDYVLFNTTSIVIDNIRVDHEGTYRCISGNGFEDDVTTFEVVVFVVPNPAHLVIDGCDHQQYCVLEAPLDGRLVCSLHGIRPTVNLDITEVFEQSSNVLHFYDKATTIKENGDTFDVLFTSKYRYSGATASRITVECKVLEADFDGFYLSTKFDLLFLKGVNTTTEENNSPEDNRTWVIVVVLASVLLPIALVACGLVKVLGKRNKIRKETLFERRMTYRMEAGNLSDQNGRKGPSEIQHDVDPGEAIPLTFKRDPSGLKEIFIAELKAKYQDLYDAVQPIPYIRDRLYCVDRVFVEGGVEYMVAHDYIGGKGTWEKLSAYQNVLNDDRVKSVRRIIEGEPGYGKSTMTLQFTYDWCNRIQLSQLQNIDILILIRLRQLGGVNSIYKAIKQFLLPKDSVLTESDVADIISKCSSVLVILDGYDEYPDQDGDVDSDVKSIIKRNMFQQFEVILTTRSSYLPKDYPGLTKRLKLTGFNDEARDQYIRKAVVGDNIEAAKKIKQRLRENPVLGDLCQVPLFFVMFAHMSHESETFQKFNSVTSFFRYMISCFHSHMINKMRDENVQKYQLNEKEHSELNKVAFEALSSKNKQIVWRKEDLCKRLGRDFYDHYVRIGILVEEEVFNISDEICYQTEVRFYHKLFCEWYAAHQLSKYASMEGNFYNYERTKSALSRYLENLDPFDVQYVYRFACGLNSTAGEKIIAYLKSRKGADHFAILCILEKQGIVTNILKDVKGLCSERVTINSDHNLLLQRSTIQLLEIAASNEISISSVYLRNCYSTVSLSGGTHFQLKSNLSIPVLTTLNKLEINTYEDGREITAEEFAGILEYSSKCLALKELWFWSCLLPQFVQAESVSVLRSRNVEVVWWTPTGNQHQLNLQSCLWERYNGEVMTDREYQSEVTKVRERREELECRQWPKPK